MWTPYRPSGGVRPIVALGIGLLTAGLLVLGLPLVGHDLGFAWARKDPPAGVVNINSANTAQLQLLPGIGPSKAERIIAYRKRHPFRTVAELGRVKGIGPKTVVRLRSHLVVRGATTVGITAAAAGGDGASSASSLLAPPGPPCPGGAARSPGPSVTGEAPDAQPSGAPAPASP